MKIAVGSDHGGVELKKHVIEFLKSMEVEVVDAGTNGEESVDYPEFGHKVAKMVADKEVERGIVICGTGIGISLAANKVPGIRCALCSEEYSAKMSREHNNANMLSLGARVTGRDLALSIVKTWVETEFEGGRHQRRVDQLIEIEKMYLK